MAPAIVQAITALIQLHRIDRWCKLIFSILFSFWTSWAFAAGTSLIAKPSYTLAVGVGLVAGSVSATVVFRTSDLAKGLLVVLPEAEATKEINTDLQTIIKS